jgi:hypothetical protein
MQLFDLSAAGEIHKVHLEHSFAIPALYSVGTSFDFIVLVLRLDGFVHARKNKRMSDEILVDKEKFDAVLKRLIEAKPMTFKEAVAKPKLNKDGTPRKPRTVQKMDEKT